MEKTKMEKALSDVGFDKLIDIICNGLDSGVDDYFFLQEITQKHRVMAELKILMYRIGEHLEKKEQLAKEEISLRKEHLDILDKCTLIGII